MTCSTTGTKRYRTLFVSDLHLGTKACQAEAFLDFLRDTDADRIYLVGDIVDFWRIKRGAYWPQSHNDVLQKLLRKVRKGNEHRLHSRQSRRGHARLLRRALRRHRHRAQHHPCRRRRQALPRHAWRRVRRGGALRQMARSVRRLELRARAVGQHPFQRRPPLVRHALLVALGLSEAQGEAGGELYRRVRDGARRRKRAGTARKA